MNPARQKFEKGLKYFFSKINFGASFLDADAIQFMNSISKQLDEIEKEAKVKE